MNERLKTDKHSNEKGLPRSYPVKERRDHKFKKAAKAVIKVGEGRGFIVEAIRRYKIDGERWMNTDRYVITAAHCLPSTPLAPSDNFETLYRNLLGPLAEEPTVWADCLFVDPVADIAVLGSPDNQSLYKQAEAYEELTNNGLPLRIANFPEQCDGWLLSLDKEWFRCKASRCFERGPIWIEDAKQGIVGSTSGSPIINTKGHAIGVLTCSAGCGDEPHTKSGPSPSLVGNLPGWFVQ